MRIKRIRFRHVGPFGAQGVTLDGFTPGLNVVCETNEFGKSTVLKALEMVLFKPFSSADKQVKSLQTAISDMGPTGEITFESDGVEYRFSKTFLKNKGARLQDNKTGEVIAIDRSAEEKLATILRADRYNGGPTGLLWVRQGTSMEGIADDGQIASRLEGELGTLIGGDRAREYLARVEAELSQVLTPKGQEKKIGPLKSARDAVAAREAELAGAIAKRDQTKSKGAELLTVNADIARKLSEGTSAQQDIQIKATRAAMIAAQGFAKSLELLDAQSAQAQIMATRAAERQAEHIAAIVTYTQTSARLEAMSGEQAAKQTALETCLAERDAVRENIAGLDAQIEALSELRLRRENQSRQSQRLEALQKDRQHLAAQFEHLKLLEDEQAQITQALADIPLVSRDDVEALRRAGNELRQCESELAALSTRLYLDLTAEGQGKVTLKGKAMPSGPIELSGGTTLELAGIGQIRSDDSRLRESTRARNTAQKNYEALLARFKVANPSDASRFADQRQALELDRKRITSDIARLTPQGRAALEDNLAAVETEAAELAEALETAQAESDAPEDNTVLEAQRAERAALIIAEDELTTLRAELASSQTEQAQLKERIDGLMLPAAEAERDKQAETLAGEKFKADADARAAAAKLTELKTKAPEQSYDMLQARLTRLENVSQQAREGLEALKTRALVLQTQRDAAFEGGDADAIVARLEAALTTDKAALARQLHLKDVRVLLRDTLIATQNRLREAYTAPVKEELTPLLARVIPGAEAALGERLGVDTVKRGGKVEAISQLSGGTQEQFAILTRLAYARLLARSGAAAPVILDDALVYADDGRRDAMFDVLGLVSSGENPIQIVYLSCHSGATAQLGGTRITPQPWSE